MRQRYAPKPVKETVIPNSAGDLTNISMRAVQAAEQRYDVVHGGYPGQDRWVGYCEGYKDALIEHGILVP